MRPQACIGDREIVLDQRRRRFHQPRILGRRLDVVRPRLVRPLGVSLRIEAIGEQPPAIGRTGLQLYRPAKGGDCFGSRAGLRARNPEFEVHRCGIRLLARERLENLDGRLRPPGTAIRGPEDEAGLRMAGKDVQDLARLLRGEFRILLEKTPRMGERDVDRPNRL